MRRTILLVSGIWPPAIGGPATHAPELGAYLVDRGHHVEAVTIAGDDAIAPGFPLHRAPPGGPRLVRIPRGAVTLLDPTRRAAVVYATGIYHRATVVARSLRTPLVVKLVNDPAYERARHLGLFDGSLEEFQTRTRDPRLSALKAARNLVASSAVQLITPSRYLASIVERWERAGPVEVVPNPAPEVGSVPGRDGARRQLGVDGPTLVFAGRLVHQKNLPLLIAAVAQLPAVRLVIVGDGPGREQAVAAVAERGVGARVQLIPSLPREQVLTYMRAADAVVLSSDWENHPHAAVEALAVGTPVAATAVGGVPEIVEHERTGLLVPPGDATALAGAMSRMLRPEIARSLRAAIAAARPDDRHHAFARIERLLERRLHAG
jgi:glycosyltransferase involved in cell wall biosynthesis